MSELLGAEGELGRERLAQCGAAWAAAVDGVDRTMALRRVVRLRALAVVVLSSWIVCAFLVTSASALWNQPVNGPVSGPGSTGTNGPAIADIGGVPYVAWQEHDGTRSQVMVARLSATGWQRVGGALNRSRTDNAIRPTLTSLGDVPYVAWEEYGGSQWHIWVSRFDGTSWQQVGGDLNPTSDSQAVQPRVGVVGGALYVAWEENSGTARQLEVDRFDNTTWQPVGEALNRSPGDNVYWAEIADVNGTPYVSWEETYAGTSHVLVDNFNGTSWQPVGGEVREAATVNAYQPSISSVGRVPYVAWEEQATPTSQWHTWAAQFDGSSWQPVGGELRTSRAANALGPSMATIGGMPYVAWEEYGGHKWHIWVAKLVNGIWRPIGGELNTASSVHSIRPALAGVGGFPFAAWKEYASSQVKVHAGRLEPDFLSGAKAGLSAATLRAVVGAYGLPYRVSFLYGRGEALTRTTATTITSGDFSPITVEVDRLSPYTRYSYRPVAGVGVGEPPALGPTQIFTTLPPPTPRVVIVSRVSRLDRHGVLSVRMRCRPGGFHCRGSVSLQIRVRSKRDRGRRRRNTGTRVAILGRRSFRIGAGHRSTIRIRLSRRGRLMATTHARLRVRAKATVRGSGAGDTHSTRTLTIKKLR